MAYAPRVGKALPEVPFDRRWGAAYGGNGSFDGDPVRIGSHDLSASNGGVAGGVDYRFSPNAVAGVALSGSSLSYSLRGGLGSGKGDAVQVGVYGSAKFDKAYASAAASFGWFDLSTDRTITLPGIVDRLTSDFSAVSFGARIESGYRFPVFMSSGITPYGAVRRSAGHPQLTGERGGADPALARRLGA